MMCHTHKFQLSTTRCTLFIKGSMSELIATTNGQVRYMEWLTKETERINAACPEHDARVHLDDEGCCWATSLPWVETGKTKKWRG